MGEEEWAPGQSCNMLGDRMGFGFSCFPFSGAISFVFLYSWNVWSPHYDRLGRSGALSRQAGRFGEDKVNKQLLPLLRQRRSRCHGPSGRM